MLSLRLNKLLNNQNCVKFNSFSLASFTSSSAEESKLSENDAKIIDLFLSSSSQFRSNIAKSNAESFQKEKLSNNVYVTYSIENALFGSNRQRAFSNEFKELDAPLNQYSGKFKSTMKSFKPGDIYSAYDLSTKQHAHYTRHPFAAQPSSPKDIYELNSFNPSLQFKNIQLLTKYLSPTGKILNHKLNGLSIKSQARIATCIRRARALGIIPYLNRPNLICSISE